MPEQTRLSLLERVRETTSGESWSEFHQVYGSLILDWLRAQGVQDQDADDIRQEVLTTLAQQISKFEHNGRPGAFRTYLRRMTVNRLKRHWRAKQRNPLAQGGPDLQELADRLSDDASRLTHLWDRQHDQVVLDFLLEKLQSRFQPHTMEAFRKVVLEQEPAKEVAQQLGMTLGAVRVAQHRVLRALEELGRDLLD